MSSTPKRVVLVDLTCPKPYDAESLKSVPLGGTEATVIRIAEALSAEGYEFVVAQHNRLEQGKGLANYTSFEALDQISSDPALAIALRTPKAIPFLQNRFNSKLALWCHDYNHQELVEDYEILADTGVRILGVSRTHKSIIADALLSQIKEVKGLKVDFVYNPVDDSLQPDVTTVYHKRLVYFASPHKGLERTLELFERIRATDHQYELYIANPGYMPCRESLPEGVINLGAIPHAEVLQHVRSAFAVFHANYVFPETFGLVYAEANAVGTPCIAHRMGSVPEILNPSEAQIVDCRDERAVIDRLEMWQRNTRPAVSCKPEFRMSSVIRKWKEIIER